MPSTLRRKDRNYEEDCDYARVIVAFADEFERSLNDSFAPLLEAARANLQRWAPGRYAAHFGETLKSPKCDLAG